MEEREYQVLSRWEWNESGTIAEVMGVPGLKRKVDVMVSNPYLCGLRTSGLRTTGVTRLNSRKAAEAELQSQGWTRVEKAGLV